MTNVGSSVVFVATSLIPIAVLAYVLRTLNTMVLGIRSVNAGVQRTADAVERIEARGRGLA